MLALSKNALVYTNDQPAMFTFMEDLDFAKYQSSVRSELSPHGERDRARSRSITQGKMRSKTRGKMLRALAMIS